jgi:hypothetical protein
MSCCNLSWRCTISSDLFNTVITFEWIKPPLRSRLYVMPRSIASSITSSGSPERSDQDAGSRCILALYVLRTLGVSRSGSKLTSTKPTWERSSGGSAASIRCMRLTMICKVPLWLCAGRKQGECQPCQGMEGLIHQPCASSLCDIDKTEPDTLPHACDRVSEAGHMLQDGACAIWRRVTRTGDVPCSLAAGMGFAPG